MRVDERTVGEYAGRAGVFEVMVVVRVVRRYAQLHPRGTQTGSRASTVSGSRARTSDPAAATSFLEKDSAGIGLAKVEAAARITGPVSDQRLEKVAMVLLTESQEGSENTGELHCGCCGGGFFVEGKASGPDSKVDRMESDGEIGRHCLLLNIVGWHHNPQPSAWGECQNGNKPSTGKGKRQPP